MNGRVVWLMGLSGAGKSTLCQRVAYLMEKTALRVFVLDADATRKGLCSDLGYSMADRTENIRRLAHAALLLSQSELIVLVAAITPTHATQTLVSKIIPSVVRVYVDAPLHVCEERDVKGLYRRARLGELQEMTAIDSPFEIPMEPHIICRTAFESIDESAKKILDVLIWENGTAASKSQIA